MSFHNNLIFSRNADSTQLSVDRIKQLAPAVFAETKADRLTDRYVSLHTSDLIPVLNDYGYVPVQAAQRSSRKKEDVITKMEHNAHLLSFAHVDALNNSGDIRPEIILYNSHDGSSSVQLYAGIFRFICSNGIVAGEGFANRMYHSKTGMMGFEDMLKNTVSNLPVMMDRIQQLKQVMLTPEQEVEMAMKGVSARWKLYNSTIEMPKGTYADSYTIQNALRVSRMGDTGSDAFTVLNRIQEAVIRGKANVRTVTEDNQLGSVRKARPVNAVKENIRINTELWNIAEEVAFS
jgi:hypothetical protein